MSHAEPIRSTLMPRRVTHVRPVREVTDCALGLFSPLLAIGDDRFDLRPRRVLKEIDLLEFFESMREFCVIKLAAPPPAVPGNRCRAGGETMP